MRRGVSMRARGFRRPGSRGPGLRRASVRALSVGVVSAALVAAGLTSAGGGETAAAQASGGPAGTSGRVIKDRMDGPQPSVPGAGAPRPVPGPDPDDVANVARQPLPEVELPVAGTVRRPVEPQAGLGVGVPADGVPVEVAVEPAGVVPPAVGAARAAGSAPVRRGPVAQGAQVSVTSLGADAATRLGSGVLAFRLTPAAVAGAPSSASGGAVRARVDYSGFAKRYGGDFAGRLQLWAYPACSVTTPQVEACQQGTQVPATNDTAAGALTAAVAVEPAATAESGTVYALAAAATSGNGNYRATSLSPDGSWAVGEQSGSFTYSYPLPAPPSVGGAAPSLAMTYDSGSIDGRSSSTNPQPSWVGSGWDLGVGYIERRYRPCADDGHATWGDLCWHSPVSGQPGQSVLVMSVGGKTTELIWESGNSYRSRDDAGWRVTRITGAANGDNDGEYWLAQAPDGSQYWFGRGTQPTTNAATGSVATVPVFGDDTGEPTCSANPNGFCVQGYRWNLDLTVDANENSTTYFYAPEEQWYSIRGDTTPPTGYDRHVRLTRVEYGEQHGAQTTTPPARVLFDTVHRCTEATVQPDPLNGEMAACTTVGESPASFPDVPVDLICREATCTAAQNSPSFFTIYRLNAVRTQVWNPNLATPGYQTVDRVQLRGTFPATGDGADPSLWLDFVQRRGYLDGNGAAAVVTSPAVNFQGVNYANRVDWDATQGKIMARRIVQVLNGMGGRVDVTYGRPNACPDTGRGGAGYAAWFATLDAKWDTNTYDCYPSYFDPDGTGPETSRTGIFHKYLTTRVDLVDTVGGSPTETTTYEYGGKPAWRWQEDLTGISHQIWNQWRGYGVVKTTHGTSTAAGGKTVTQNTYFRGMHGDRTQSGTPKNIVLTDWRGEQWEDRPSLQGRLLQSRSYSSDGATELSASQHRYWQDLKVDGPAWYDAITTVEDRVFTRERVIAETAGGTDTWRERQVDRTFNTYGLPLTENERGDNLASSADDKCTQTAYAQNVEAVGSWNYHVSRPSDVQTWHGPCGTGTLTGRVQTIYDGAASTDPAVNKPVDGNPTATITHHTTSNGGTTTRAEATYDAFGRVRSTTAPNEVGAATPRRTTITYAPSTGHPINGITTTNPAGHVTVTYPTLHHGSVARVKDANDKWTHVAYDAFARPTKVWLPTEGGAATVPTGNPSHRFTYPATVSSPSQPTTPRQVLTEQLQSTWQTPAVYLPTYSYVDGFGRDRETQAPSPSGNGRMVTVTTYNDRGLPAVQSPPQFNSAAAGSGLLNPAAADLTSYTVTDYDDRERAWRARHYTGGATTPDRTTLTLDKGNRVETTPARGERTISYYDTFGRTTQLRKYSSPTAFATTSYAYSYSADGSRVDVTDPHTTVTSFLSDLAGRRVKMIDPNAGTSEYWYDNNGNTIQTRDPAGTINTEYDVLDRPTIRRSTPPGGTTTDQYESARWAYDPPNAKGHLSYSDSTTRTTIDGATQDFTIRKSIPAYDGRYRPTSSNTVLPTSSALGALSGVSYYEEYVYDAADHLTRVVYPGIGDLPAERADTAYSAYGTPTTYSLTPNGGTAMPVVTGVTWTGSGQLDKRTMASGAIRDIDWDESWRAPQFVGTYWQPEDQEWPFFWQLDEYTRDQAGNVTSITDHALAPTQSQCFWYDSWNRLTDARTTDPNQVACDAPMADTDTSWNTGPEPYRARWAYNANDDITTASVADITGTGTVAWTNHTYTRGDSGHPSAVTGIAPSVRGWGNDAFGYDAAGRMTTRLTNGINHNLGWNPTHQLTSTKKINGSTVTPHRYAYDTGGGRVLKIGTDEVTAYFGDTQVTARLIAPGAGSITGIRHYNQDGASVAKRNGTEPIRYLFDDTQGSATLAVDTGNPATASISRQRYTPYGNTRGYANQLNIERGWLGQIEDDATGLTYLNARYYDPATARFISPDPLLNPGDPQTLNPYTYARNNPLTLTDATGLDPDDRGTCGAYLGSTCPPAAGGPSRADGEHGGPLSNRRSTGSLRSTAEIGEKPLFEDDGGNGGEERGFEQPQQCPDGGLISQCAGYNLLGKQPSGRKPGYNPLKPMCHEGLAGALVCTNVPGDNDYEKGGIPPLPGGGGGDKAREAAEALKTWQNLAPNDPLFPSRTVPLDRLRSINGRFQYVVREDGSLVVGRGGHIDLSRGDDVLAAGEVRVVNGEVRMLNNASGHYKPDASIEGIARSAFERQAGLKIRGEAWQPISH
jgi:RHS repeat-associated protein